MTEILTGTLCAALRDAGIPAAGEYPQGMKSVPESRCFVTAAAAKTLLADNTGSAGGNAKAGSVTLRVRFHWRSDFPAAEAENAADSVIRAALRQMHCAVYSVTRGEVQYLKNIDRMMRETLWVIGAVCTENAAGNAVLSTPDESLSLTLGTLSLPAEDYILKTEVPVIRQTLCDGTPHFMLLEEIPCSLTVSGRFLIAESAGIAAALDAAMRAHTAYDFTFAGIGFTGMKMISVTWKKYAGTTEFTIVMIGGTGA